MRREIVAFLLSSLLASCSSGENGDPASEEHPSPSHAEPFTLKVEARAHDGGRLAVSGETNLPDGTLVSIIVGRNALVEGVGVFNFSMGFDDAKVEGGGFRTDVTVDEGLLDKAVHDPGGLGPIKAIADTVTVCAQVRPNDDQESPQPPDVMKAIGEGGENFESSSQKHVTELGLLRLDTATSTFLPSETVPPSVPRKRRVGGAYCA